MTLSTPQNTIIIFFEYFIHHLSLTNNFGKYTHHNRGYNNTRSIALFQRVTYFRRRDKIKIRITLFCEYQLFIIIILLVKCENSRTVFINFIFYVCSSVYVQNMFIVKLND